MYANKYNPTVLSQNEGKHCKQLETYHSPNIFWQHCKQLLSICVSQCSRMWRPNELNESEIFCAAEINRPSQSYIQTVFSSVSKC